MNLRESAAHRWILVADGDETSARFVANFLLQARLRAYPTARGLEAMQLVGRFRLSLAVVDVDLLDMSGCELVGKLRAIEPGLPVVMTTADYSPATEVQARQLGIVQYIHKPIDLHRLDRVVSRLLGPDAQTAPRITVGSNGNVQP
ncbi:MAG: response regulator [Candidatus Rokuibacteriota bacterium]